MSFSIILEKIWFNMPIVVQNKILGILKCIPKTESIVHKLSNRLGYRELRNYAKYLAENFDNEVAKIKENPKFIKIDLNYHVGFFNAGILIEVVEYTVIAMQRGYIPIILINGNLDDMKKLCVNWFFLQPYQNCFGLDRLDFEKISVVEETIQCKPYRIEMKYLWDMQGEEWQLWSSLAKKILSPNKFLMEYVEEDMKKNGILSDKFLGVLIRGTDYIKLKPRLHPVQPELDEIIDKIEENLKVRKQSCIYLATDEKRIHKMLIEYFGKEMIFSNTREYYDDIYRDNNLWQICEAKKERENDQYLNSLEYISSMMILSKCNGIVGGNCTGSLLASLLSNSDYKYIFNKGVYF